MRRSIPFLLLFVALFEGAGPIAGQLSSFSPSLGDSFADGELSTREKIDQLFEEARWSVGRLRLDPSFGIGNLSYVGNLLGDQEASQTDLQLSIHAGLVALTGLGEDSYFSAWAKPEYSWWQDSAERRRLHETFGVGVYSYWSRLNLEIQASREEALDFAALDALALIDQRTDRVRTRVSVQLVRSLRLEVAAEQVEYSQLPNQGDPFEIDARRLDRTQSSVEAGLGIRLGRSGRLVAGVKDSKTKDTIDLDYDTAGIFSRFSVAGDRSSLTLEITSWESDPGEDSNFPGFKGETYSAVVGFSTRDKRGAFSLFTDQRLDYVLAATEAFAETTSYGGSYRRKLSTRVDAHVGLELRDIQRVTLAGNSLEPENWTRSNAGLAFHFTAHVGLELDYEDFDVQTPSGDRNIGRLNLRLLLSGPGLSWP